MTLNCFALRLSLSLLPSIFVQIRITETVSVFVGLRGVKAGLLGKVTKRPKKKKRPNWLELQALSITPLF